MIWPYRKYCLSGSARSADPFVYRAGSGHLDEVCEKRSTMQDIRSEAGYYLGNQPVVISPTNLVELQTGK
jgi:hypothetical protein